MAEKHQRCRFHPDCSVHLGERRIVELSYAERAAAARAYWRGVRPIAIARRHELSANQVYYIAHLALDPDSRWHVSGVGPDTSRPAAP